MWVDQKQRAKLVAVGQKRREQMTHARCDGLLHATYFK